MKRQVQNIIISFTRLENILFQEPLIKTSRLIKALHQIAENIHQRSLVILFSDMFDNSDENEELFLH